MNKTIKGLVALAMGSLLSGAALAADAELRFSDHMSSESSVYQAVNVQLKEFIEKESGGRIKVSLYPNGILHANYDGFKALATDITDIAPAYPQFSANSFGLAHGFFLPGAFQSVHAAVRAGEELYGKYVRPEYEAMGVEVLFFAASAPYQLLTIKPVASLADIRNMKVRGAGGAVNQMITALGAVPVTVTAAEIYTAFQQGVIDGVLIPTESILTLRIEEVAKYFIPLDLGRAGFIPFGLNRKTYEALPDDLKEVIYRAGRHGSLLYADWDEEGIQTALRRMEEKGIVTVELPEADRAKIAEAQQALWNEFIETNKARGLPAEEFVAEMKRLSDELGNLDHDGMVQRQKDHPVSGVLPGF